MKKVGAHTSKNSLKNHSACQVLNRNLYRLFLLICNVAFLFRMVVDMVCLFTQNVFLKEKRIIKKLEIVITSYFLFQ